MSVQELLAERGLRTALIVDDGYDTVPKAEDISANNEGWAVFIDDVMGDDAKLLAEVFPAYDDLSTPQLRQSDQFVEAVYNLKGRIRESLWNSLFDTYEQGRTTDFSFLKSLEKTLAGLGVTLIRSGRELPKNANTANIVFADLFLGAAQSPADMSRSITRLKEILSGRDADPPVVILMSRSSLLKEKRAIFRDEAKILGTMFRVYSKADLSTASTVELALERLARHYNDAVTAAKFLQAWEAGLKGATERFLDGVRRLDLSDYGQIKQLLLAFEGQSLGSYMMDVFDRVLQHEIEGDLATIAAAKELSKVDTEQYPAPHISGSADLQDLVYRTIWQNPRRLAVEAAIKGAPVSFGDVLIRQAVAQPSTAESAVPKDSHVPQQPPIVNGATADALVVLTPACDLVRDGGPKRVLLISGTVADLTPKTWTYKGAAAKTPILVLAGTRRVWIQWDVKDIYALRPVEIGEMIDKGEYLVSHRLRDSHALELQQRYLSHVGRVGVVASMPATFPVSVAAYYLGVDEQLKPIPLQSADRDGGVCFAGRDSGSDESARLVLTEEVIDELLAAMQELDENLVHQRARDGLKYIQGPSSLASDFGRSIEVPSANKRKNQAIKVKATGNDGQGVEAVVGYVSRNPDEPLVHKGETKHGALILVLRDQEFEAAMAQAFVDPNLAKEDDSLPK